MSVPTTKLAMEKSHEVGLVVEGLAADRFQDAGLFSSGSKAKLLFRGTENHQKMPFSVKPEPLLENFQPDIVVVTRSFPDSLESVFGQAANKMRIPVVLMEDFWNGHKSWPAEPSTVVTLDEYAAELASKTHPTAQVVVAGNPTVIPPEQMDIPAEVRAKVEELRARFGRVFIFAGGNPEQMTIELQLLIECLKLTKNWCLISRPHPTIARGEKEPGLKWSDFWNDMLKPLGERIVSVECKMGDHLAMLCDATISGFSLMLNTAAYARKAAISLQTEKGKEELFNSVGLLEVPIAALGCVRLLNEPCDLDVAGLIQQADENKLARLKPFDPVVALEAIEQSVQ